MAKRWVRYVMPVMVDVDGEADEVSRVVTLAEEIRPDRDHRGHALIYDESFVRRRGDAPPQIHASAVAEPRWKHPRFADGPPLNWPDPSAWEAGFDLTEADDPYSEIDPYGEPDG